MLFAWFHVRQKVKNIPKFQGGMGDLYNPDYVRVANGGFFDLGFESEKILVFYFINQCSFLSAESNLC